MGVKTVTIAILTYAALLIGAVLLEALVRPRPPRILRSLPGLALLLCMTGALFGLCLALCGNDGVSAVVALALMAFLALASNAKRAMLGEPLVFSDLELLGAIFRHPQFYLSAITIVQRVAIALAAAGLLVVLAWLFVAAPAAHFLGAGLLLGNLAILAGLLSTARFRAFAPRPDADADVARHGMFATLLLYWLRWRESVDPAPCAEVARQAPTGDVPELVVLIQCESFADPVELFGDAGMALPGLTAARAQACQWGDLQVSGFGAYTMRTEYGVLFGIEEEALGFRRYNPFLTAMGEGSHALPTQLRGWRSLFVHPHDMRFYGRDKILPAGGFARLVGEENFAPPGPQEGRYVTDAAMADEIMDLAGKAEGPTLIYAVTIENHGPWASDGTPGAADLVQSYLRLVRKGDAMLKTLSDGLCGLRRPALLVFFGDHRPSIPGASMPGGARHTPYVMIRMDAEGRIVPGDNRHENLTPAALHHALLGKVLGEVAERPA